MKIFNTRVKSRWVLRFRMNRFSPCKLGSAVFKNRGIFQFFFGVLVGILLTFSRSGQIFHLNIESDDMDSGIYRPEDIDDPNIIIDNSIAQALHKHVRVLCWVMTHPTVDPGVLEAIKMTWGRRCDKLLFMSSENDTNPEVVALPGVVEGREWLWMKTRKALNYVYEHHLDDADWFFKADDDTYTILENLRYLLSKYDPKDPLYFGCHLKNLVIKESQGYMSGGAGYILSREALVRFVERSMNNPSLCKTSHDGSEDWELGRCLEVVDVVFAESRDSDDQNRFHVFNTKQHINLAESGSQWYTAMIKYHQEDGLRCCSETAITFHYNNAADMITLEYLIYFLNPYGLSRNYENPLDF